MFKCFPIPFCNKSREQIDKRHCNLTTVPDHVLRHTRTLEELLLDANQLQYLPAGVFSLTQLRRLTFSDNEIQRISSEIGQLVNLEELDCSRNDIAEIPDNIRHCRSLQRLDCSGNPLANNLPSGIIQLRQLSQLTLNDVSLAELPKDLGSLTNLRVLEVRENLLKVLPNSIVQLNKLESLDAGSNVLEQLPEKFGQLQSLKELWLDANELIELPSDLGQLKRLQCLDVSENKLTSIPDEIGALESLTNFELSSNQIEEIPTSIGQLSQRLLILKINSNSLNHLCDEIGQCLALNELILTENALVELPQSIGNLKKLTNLNVDRNQLTNLPVEISGCESLNLLSLRDNRLSEVPSELSKLRHLHVLDLSGNRLLNLPCSLLECDLRAIWLAENQAQPMLKFATDIDPNTGEKVLTCYLLPQQQFSSSSTENLLNTGKTGSTTQIRMSTNPSASIDENSIHERTGSVKFADQSDETKESSLQRHNTPHPKDLRTWRNKMAKKFQVTDGNLLHHDHRHPFQPNAHRDSMTSANQQEKSTEDSIEYVPPEISTENDVRDDDQHDSMVYVEKHVEFTDDLNEDDENSTKDHHQQQKLHRRDTPHHLKNKRILNKTAEPLGDELKNFVAHSSTKSSLTSPGKDSRSSSNCGGNARLMTIQQEQLTLIIRRSTNTGLGISIAGGIGSTPYKDNDYGIFLTKINEEGPAAQAGLLVGDKLISVNGTSLIDCEHSDAVAALKKAGDQIEMIVMREILSSNDVLSTEEQNSMMKEGEKFSTIIRRDEKNGGNFGFSIAGGTTNSSSSTNGNENFYISNVHQEENSSIAVGDRLLAINGHETGNLNHDQAVEIIQDAGNNVELIVYREKLTTNGHENIDNTIEEARVAKGNGPMGLSIVGGIDQACPPFGLDQRGVFVSKILPNGSASRTNLRIGDRILKVNNRDVSQATHLEAVEALLQPTNEVVLLVRHDPQPAGLKEITLTKQVGEPLGIRINGGVDGKRVNPDDPEDDGIFVTEVKDGSPAAGFLTVGTRILEVNNQSLFGARLDDAQKWLSSANGKLQLLICHGFKPKESIVISPTKSSMKQNGTNSSPKIVSPIKSPQPPPVPAKPVYRPQLSQTFVPINDEQTTSNVRRQSQQNGYEVDESDISVTESERSFKDKKKFFESGFKETGPKPKPRQFKYINEHELYQMKQEEEQKIKTMSPNDLFQSRTHYDSDLHETQSMQTTLSQYETERLLAKSEDEEHLRNLTSAVRVNPLERDAASAHSMLSKFVIADSAMT